MFRDICQEHGIRNFFICNYYAASNPVERHNKTIKIALSQYSKDDHRDWDIYLPFVTFAINTSVSTATGYTPAYLNFGGELRHRFALADSLSESPMSPFNPNEYAEKLKSSSAIAMKKALDIIRKVKARQAKTYNARRREIHYKVGELVWRRNYPLSSKIDHIAAKMCAKYIGPYMVSKILSPTQYELAKIPTGDPAGRWHVNQLKPLVFDEKEPSPVPCIDSDEENPIELPDPIDEDPVIENPVILENNDPDPLENDFPLEESNPVNESIFDDPDSSILPNLTPYNLRPRKKRTISD